MNFFFKKFTLLLILFFLNNPNLYALTLSAHALNEQMQQFRHRIQLYIKCLPLRSDCTPQERQSAATTVFKDGALLLSILAIIVAGLFVGKKIDYELTKRKYTNLHTQLRNVLLLETDYTLPQDSPEFKAANKKAEILQNQMEKLKSKLRSSFYYVPKD